MEASSPETFVGNYFDHTPDPTQPHVLPMDANDNNHQHFTVDDLLDFSNKDDAMTDAFFNNSADDSTITVVDMCNSSVSGGDTNLSCRSFTDSQFSGTEFCVPYDDLAELEWLSNFVEESFSSDDQEFIPTTIMPLPPTIPAAVTDVSSSSSSITTKITQNSPPIFPSDVSVPGKARSKRSRAAPCDWSSRLLHLSPSTSLDENTIITSNKYSIPAKTTQFRRKEFTDITGRKCLHCGSEKTPQWRTGPMGPKTLCNACGVRYKSGRLVPEYRPASSPTFVSAKHSNSHRKVVELRRQKEFQMQQHMLSQNQILAVSNGPEDYLIHHQRTNGPDFRHMI